MKKEIIYSLKVMEQLVKLGYIPIATIPNPKNTKFNCWVFEQTEEFQKDLSVVLKEASQR